MKVENRKLFSNRDARSKLANMGGIMTSSPELMGEAQRFAAGDEVVAPSMFLVQVPGFIGGNEFLHLTSSELQLLSQSQPELMGQDGVVIQEATPEILSELNPAQLATTDNNNVKRMFADLGVDLPEAEPSAQAPVEAAGGDEGGLPFLFSDTTGVSRDGRTDAEIIAQAQALMGSNAVPAPAREGLETLGDVVEENPQTANRQAALAKLKEQVSNFSLFPDAARREENLSRFLDGAIDTPSGAVTAPQTESEQLLASSLPMNVAADSGPESGMFYDDVKGGFNIMPPAAYDAETPAAREARILAESMALIAERSPEAIARINAGTSISSRVNNIVEPVEAQAQTFPDIKPGQGYGREAFGSGNIFTSGQQPTMTESEQLLAVAPVAEQASLPMNVAADSGPESGMFSDDVKGGFNIMPPPPYDTEPRSNILASQQDAQRMMEINATPPATPPDGYQIITNRSGAPQSVNQRRINPDKIAKITERFANGEITEAQYQGQKKEYENAVLQDNAHKAYSADQQAVTDAATAKADAEQAAILEATLDSKMATAIENDDTALVEALRETKAKKAPPVDPKFDEIDDGTGTDFKQIIDLNAAQKVVDPLVIKKEDGKDGTATGGNGNSVANSFLGTSGTPTENVAKYEARFKDMLGIKDEDKAKEMWHNMSMIGFAIAAGQDPNALANVANGMLAGTKMMKEDRASDKALMAKANIAAFDAEREDLRDAETFRQQKILAGMKSTAAFRSSRNPDEFRQNQYTAAFKQFGEAVGDALTGRKPPADALPGESQEQYAQRKGDLAYDYAVRNSGTASAGPAAGPAVGDTLNDVNLGPLVFTEKNGWQKA